MLIFKLIQGIAIAACTQAAMGQQVALNGVLGSKALLIVDGSALKSVAPGGTHQGVKVLSTTGDSAVVDIKGQRVNLRVGDAPASVGAKAGTGGATKIVLQAGRSTGNPCSF